MLESNGMRQLETLIQKCKPADIRKILAHTNSSMDTKTLQQELLAYLVTEAKAHCGMNCGENGTVCIGLLVADLDGLTSSLSRDAPEVASRLKKLLSGTLSGLSYIIDKLVVAMTNIAPAIGVLFSTVYIACTSSTLAAGVCFASVQAICSKLETVRTLIFELTLDNTWSLQAMALKTVLILLDKVCGMTSLPSIPLVEKRVTIVTPEGLRNNGKRDEFTVSKKDQDHVTANADMLAPQSDESAWKACDFVWDTHLNVDGTKKYKNEEDCFRKLSLKVKKNPLSLV